MAVIICQLFFSFKTTAQTSICDKGMWSHYNHAKIHQMCFLTDQKWFMVGSFSTILVTENAGKTWNKVDVRDYFPFIDIDFFNEKEGLITRYAFIPGGIPTPACFVRTVDGGKTWNPIPTPFLPTELFVTDSVTAYANSWEYQGAYMTTTKGNNWKKAKISGQEVNYVRFASKELGWAYTNSGVLRTVDGGKNWASYTVPSFLDRSKHIPQPFVLSKDKTTLWVINIGTKTIGRSVDKGTTWTVSQLPDISFQIEPISNQKALFVYGESIYETIDGGQTWKENTKINGHASTSFFFLNEKRGYYVGSHTQALGTPFGSNSRTIVETENGGQTWNTISESPIFLSFDMLNSKVGYAGSYAYNGVLKTEDGGVTWKTIFKKENTTFTKLKVFDENHIMMLSPSQQSDVGGIFYTKNKGATWEVSPILDSVFHYAMHDYYPIDSLKWIGVYGANYVTTQDGGRTYKPFKTPSAAIGFFVEDISFLEGNTFVAILHPSNADSLTSRIYKTIDGGNSWQIVQSFKMSYYSNANKIYFKNGQVGFIVNTTNNSSFDIGKDVILRTINGGNTWQEIKIKIPKVPETSYIYNAFDYYDKDNFTFFLYGSESLCYSTKDGGNTWLPSNRWHPYIKYDRGYDIHYVGKDSIFIAGANSPFFNVITPLQKPSLPLGLQGDTIVKLGDTTLHTLIIQVNEDDYKWSLESGGTVLGTHIDSVAIKWTKAGYHRLKLVSINPCGESTPNYFTIKVEDTNSLVDKIKTTTTVFPNPTDGHLSIKVPEFKQVTSIEIRDLIGRQVYILNNLNWSNDIFDINLLEIPEGIYFIITQLDDGKDIHKIIINK